MPDETPPIVIEGDEPSRIDPSRADGGLPPLAGVRNVQVFRASKALRPDGDRGWTYHHHVDMACWRGRLYVAWDSCQQDEDVWPSRELYSTSSDGQTWTDPADLFPIAVSTPLRMYFYHAPNGRMLAIAGLRTALAPTNEDKKQGLVVREIRPDHTLGHCYVLQGAGGDPLARPLDDCRDDGFLRACHALRADRVFLEQQDRGRLLGPRRMKWHDPAAWPDGAVPGRNDKWVAGKAYSFYRRPDGVVVGVSKMGWTTTSADDGDTWTQPVVPPTLVTGTAKVWGQRTRDGRYALAYNPSASQRYPLVVVTGDDGTRFAGMRVAQGELPRQRYQGEHRSVGPQYVRGISTWADDGSRKEKVMWLAYSMSKEDIWVSRIDLPIRPDGEGWHVYRPKWGRVDLTNDDILLECADPYDHVAATRIFSARQAVTISFDVEAPSDSADALPLEFELLSKFAGQRAASLQLSRSGPVTIRADVRQARYTASGNAVTTPGEHAFQEPAEDLHRVVFRVGPHCDGPQEPPSIDPATDRPRPPVAYRIRHLRITWD